MEENNTNRPQEPQQQAPQEPRQQGPQEPGAYPHERPRFAPPPEPAKKGKVGGYVAVGATCLLIGIALGSLLTGLISMGARTLAGAAQSAAEQPGSQWSWRWPFSGPDAQEEPQPSTAAPETVEPPEYISRPLPSFDGAAPNLEGVANPLPDIVEGASGGVVGIDVYYYYDEVGQEALAGYGSGFVISSEGYIVTNAHVVEDASKVMVKFVDGGEAVAELVGADAKLDVAVLKVGKAGLTPLALGESAAVRVGDFTVAIGNPTGERLADTATFGIISATARETNVDGKVNSYLQTDAAINPGSSGGPLLDMQGRVIGITSAKTLYAGYDDYGNMVNAEGIGYAIPIDDAMDVVRQLITKGHVVRPGVGITVVTIDELYAAEYDIPEGILVYSVTKNGPAHHADLRINDIILAYDGIDAGEHSDLVDYVAALAVGDTIGLRVWRDGEELDITLTVADLNVIGTEVLNNEYADIID